MFKVISDILSHWYDLWNTIVIAINFYNSKELCIDVYHKQSLYNEMS